MFIVWGFAFLDGRVGAPLLSLGGQAVDFKCFTWFFFLSFFLFYSTILWSLCSLKSCCICYKEQAQIIDYPSRSICFRKALLFISCFPVSSCCCHTLFYLWNNIDGLWYGDGPAALAHAVMYKAYPAFLSLKKKKNEIVLEGPGPWDVANLFISGVFQRLRAELRKGHVVLSSEVKWINNFCQ